jgi:hypothetical protein
MSRKLIHWGSALLQWDTTQNLTKNSRYIANDSSVQRPLTMSMIQDSDLSTLVLMTCTILERFSHWFRSKTSCSSKDPRETSLPGYDDPSFHSVIQREWTKLYKLKFSKPKCAHRKELNRESLSSIFKIPLRLPVSPRRTLLSIS